MLRYRITFPAFLGSLWLFVETLLAAFLTARIPGDERAAFLFGLSPSRLALVVVILAIGSGGLFAAWWLQKNASLAQKYLTQERFLRPAVLLSAYALLLITLVDFVLAHYHPERYLAYYHRLHPFLLLLVILAAEGVFFFLFVAYERGFLFFHRSGFRALLRSSWMPISGMLALWGLVAVTGVGITPDPVFWSVPGAPLPFWMFCLAVGVSSLFLLARGLFPAFASRRWVDAVIMLSLWVLASAIWLSIPLDVMRDSYYAPITPPDFQPFPFSDAGNYDSMAQSLLLGNGLLGTVPHRPFYILILSIFHALVGDNYVGIITLQTLWLAGLPVFLFALGRRVHSRSAGLLIAFLAIAREVTNLWVSPYMPVSNSKTLMSDLPTTFGVALLILLMTRWAQNHHRSLSAWVAVSGVLGLLTLTRTQAILLSPFVLLAALLVEWPSWRRWLRHMLVLVVVVAMVLAPWLYRNWRLTGKFVFDEPFSQTKIVAERYTTEVGFSMPRRPGEDVWDYSERLSSHVVAFLVAHPDVVARFTVNHFFANEMYTLLALPTSLETPQPLSKPVMGWWRGKEYYDSINPWLILLYLLLIGLGLSAAWKRARWVGLFPLFIQVGYSLSNAVVRNSGWRFILPVEWVTYFYLAVGLMEVLT
ncbi:hypothetical protein D6833_08125, partial [Candidatus Parcubacteria bacterium]